jgi:hypothetical protein
MKIKNFNQKNKKKRCEKFEKLEKCIIKFHFALWSIMQRLNE